MKMSLHQLLSLSLFISLYLLPSIAISVRVFPKQPVIGVDGKELKIGELYYVFPGVAGLCLTDNAKCPEDVIQCPEYYDDVKGIPLTFLPINMTGDTVVREDTPYRITFSLFGDCGGKGFWYVKDGGNDQNALEKFVKVGSEAKVGAFKVQKVLVGYKIVYCTQVSWFVPVSVCVDLGFVWQNGYNRLGSSLGLDPTPFSFINASAVPVHSHHHDKLSIV